MRFIVSGSSMEPTYKAGDRLWVSRLLNILFKPEAGDVVVLRDPRDGRLVLKRIMKIAPDGYFMKGDNENESTDSRTFGLIKKENIIGKVLFRYKKGL